MDVSMRKDVHPHTLAWREFLQDELRPVLERERFKHLRSQELFKRDDADVLAYFGYHLDLDRVTDDALLEISASMSSKALGRAAASLPGVERFGGVVSALGMGGAATLLPPADADLFYLFDTSTRDETFARVASRVREQVIPFWNEFQEPSRLLDVLLSEAHPFAKELTNAEVRLAGAVLFLRRDRDRARALVERAAARLRKELPSARTAAQSRSLSDDLSALSAIDDFIRTAPLP
jgi:hypothetical protein